MDKHFWLFLSFIELQKYEILHEITICEHLAVRAAQAIHINITHQYYNQADYKEISFTRYIYLQLPRTTSSQMIAKILQVKTVQMKTIC